MTWSSRPRTGYADLVWQDTSGGGSVQIRYMQGAGITGAATPSNGTALRIHDCGNLNRDRAPDLFLDDSAGNFTVWYTGARGRARELVTGR